MIKLIIFDGYGVVFKTGGYVTTATYLAKKYGLSYEKIYSVLYTKYFNLASTRKISQQEGWAKPLKELGIPLGVKEVKKIHYQLMSLDDNLLKFALSLKKDNQIILLSKNTRSQWRDINHHFPKLRKVFGKNLINTWEYNLPKASKKTIQFICDRYKVKPENVIYLDDQPENLIEAKKLGVKTVVYKDFEWAKKEINNFL